MPDAGAIVTAPFIRERAYAGRPCFQRIDPAVGTRPYIAATPVVRRLLTLCAQERSQPEIRAAFAAEDRAAIEEAVDELVRLGFLLPTTRLSLHRPSLELEITNRCNANCIMCPREQLRPLGHMTADTFERVLELVETLRLPGVVLQGIGEPTVHPSLVPWVERLRQAAGPDAQLVLVTNGFTMTPALLGRLVAAGIDLVQWSFHSLDAANYNAIMGVPTFDRARANLEACAREYADYLSINYVVMDRNLHEIDAMRAWVAALGIAPERLGLIECFSRGGYIDSHALLSEKETEPAGRCLFIRKSLFVAWNGDLLPCSNDIRGEAVLGNLATLTPAAVLTTWRDDLLAQPCRFGICTNCDHHSRGTLETRWFNLMRGQELAQAPQESTP